jgi:hypothetical protein
LFSLFGKYQFQFLQLPFLLYPPKKNYFLFYINLLLNQNQGLFILVHSSRWSFFFLKKRMVTPKHKHWTEYKDTEIVPRDLSLLIHHPFCFVIITI